MPLAYRDAFTLTGCGQDTQAPKDRALIWLKKVSKLKRFIRKSKNRYTSFKYYILLNVALTASRTVYKYFFTFIIQTILH